LKDVILPSGVEPIPKNLGDVSHGKLKASQWKSLFLYIIPLIILELLVLDVEDFPTLSTRHTIVRNIASLVRCTQIVMAKTTNKYNIDQFRKMYAIYGETSAQLFNNIRVVPNHHYALHLPDMMHYWGPLMGVSEFAGERINGLLQKFKTNHHLGKSQLDGTMITKMCALQRWTGKFSVPAPEKEERQKETAQIRISDAVYNLLLPLLQLKFPELRNYNDWPHPAMAKVLQPFATPISKIIVDKVSHSIDVSAKAPNDCVIYKKEGGRKQYTKVIQLYRFENGMGGIQEAALVEPINDVFAMALDCPSQNFRYYNHLMGSIIGQIDPMSPFFIDPVDIITNAAYRILPPHTFGLADGGIILKP
ncbi:hypothetical protein DFH28DRAFT_824597, partial [Melampsora americana]